MDQTINRWTIAAGLLAAPFYLTLIISLGVLELGFSHFSMPMSILGGVSGVRGLIFNLGVAVTGLLVIIFGTGLWLQLPPKMTAKIGVALMVIGGLGMMGAGYFHCNQDCKNIFIEPNFIGQLHIITSLLAGMGTGLAPFFIWLAIRSSQQWQSLATATLVAAILANLPGIIFWITIFTDYRLQLVEGLIQRMGFVVILIWIFFVAVRLKIQEISDN